MAKIGVQAMMLSDRVAEIGAFGTLRQVAAIGSLAVGRSQIALARSSGWTSPRCR